MREAIKEMMENLNYNPFKEMILIAKSKETAINIRASMASELAQYIAPKLKGVDIEAKGSVGIQVVVQRFADEILSDQVPKTLDLSQEPKSLEPGKEIPAEVPRGTAEPEPVLTLPTPEPEPVRPPPDPDGWLPEGVEVEQV